MTKSSKKPSKVAYFLAVIFGILGISICFMGFQKFGMQFLGIAVVSAILLSLAFPIIADIYLSYVIKKNPHSFEFIRKVFSFSHYKKIYKTTGKALLGLFAVLANALALTALFAWGVLYHLLNFLYVIGYAALFFLVPPVLFTLILDIAKKDLLKIGKISITRQRFLSGWLLFAVVCLFVFNRIRSL